MSQLTALLALLHNGLVDIIRRHEGNAGPNGQFGAAYKRFLCARGALTAKDANWLVEPPTVPRACQVKIRYNAPAVPARVEALAAFLINRLGTGS